MLRQFAASEGRGGPAPDRPQLGEPAAPGRSAGTRAGPGSLRCVPVPHRPHEKPGSTQPYRDGGDQPATPGLPGRSIRRHPKTNCHSQNASGCVASASFLKDFPFPRSPREISASQYPSRWAERKRWGPECLSQSGPHIGIPMVTAAAGYLAPRL